MSAAGQVRKEAVRSIGDRSRQAEELRCLPSCATEVPAGVRRSRGGEALLRDRTAKEATAGKAASPVTHTKLLG